MSSTLLEDILEPITIDNKKYIITATPDRVFNAPYRFGYVFDIIDLSNHEVIGSEAILVSDLLKTIVKKLTVIKKKLIDKVKKQRKNPK